MMMSGSFPCPATGVEALKRCDFGAAEQIGLACPHYDRGQCDASGDEPYYTDDNGDESFCSTPCQLVD